MTRTVHSLFLGGCAFIGGVVGSILLHHSMTRATAQSTPPPPAPAPINFAANPLAQLSDRFEAVVKQVSPAVVSIEAIKPPPPATNGATQRTKPVEESGSGILVRLDGINGIYVITNNHVVNNAPADKITVHLADDRMMKPTQVWADPESDVAVLKLPLENAPTALLGDSDRMRVGHWVIAFGSPFGLNQTVTHGIISARERGQISLGNTIRIKDFLQTDAAINPGSSGGPLVNLAGEVIGINTAIASQSGNNSGVAFSIPMNLVQRIARQLVEKGVVSRGYLGVQLAQAMDAEDARRLGLDKVQGALVESVYPDTPAAEAGLKTNDVILQIDNVVIKNENHLINLISGMPAGQKIRLQVWRNRQMQSLDVTIGDWTAAKSRLQGMQ